MTKLSDLNRLQYAQRERLAFIDYCLQYIGKVSRISLVRHFNVGLASCSRDLKLYHSLTRNNTEFSHSDKYYYRAQSFKPLFEHDPSAVLVSLMRGFGDGLSNPKANTSWVFDAPSLIFPNPETIGAVTRAIIAEAQVQITYQSLSSGESSRTIVPHAIVNNGQRWHVRAFDHKSNEFRDFVCTRIQAIQIQDSLATEASSSKSDEQWHKQITLELVPHPSLRHAKPIEMDFAMTNAIRKIKTRAALAGYLLRYWNVDCGVEAALTKNQHQLWLKNAEKLNDVVSMKLTQGYIQQED